MCAYLNNYNENSATPALTMQRLFSKLQAFADNKMDASFRARGYLRRDGASAHVLRKPIRQPRGDLHVEPRRTERILASRSTYLRQRRFRRVTSRLAAGHGRQRQRQQMRMRAPMNDRKCSVMFTSQSTRS